MNGNLARLHFLIDLEIAITGRTLSRTGFEWKVLLVTPQTVILEYFNIKE
jgi:hypothetical protein